MRPQAGPIAAAANHDMPPIKVLYIAGAHRSGTTVLSRALGSYDGFFDAGELHEIWAGLRDGRPCSCDRTLHECHVWQPILSSLTAHSRDLAAAIAQRDRSARIWHTPRLVAQARTNHRASGNNYQDLMRDVYRTIATTQRCRVIVDSTKIPAGAALLSGMPGVEAFVLHLVRDPRATCHSWSKPKGTGTVPDTDDLHTIRTTTAGLRWLGYNALSELLRYIPTSRYRQLRYEDLILQPRKTIARIGNWMDEPMHPDPFTDDITINLSSGHSVAGNPDRFTSGPRQLKLDNRWQREMPTNRRLYISTLTAPLRRRYKYGFGASAFGSG